MNALATRLKYSIHKVITSVDPTNPNTLCPADEAVLYAVQLTERDLKEIIKALEAVGEK